MPRRLAIVLLFLLGGMLAGCAIKGDTRYESLKNGMSQSRVEKLLGKPRARWSVLFAGHKSPFVVWEYLLPAKGCGCAPERLSRGVAAVVTLGLSEAALDTAVAKPHWLYFSGGRLVHKSLAMDCRPRGCKKTLLK